MGYDLFAVPSQLSYTGIMEAVFWLTIIAQNYHKT